MTAAVAGLAYHLPEGELTNADLARQFPDWGVEKIAAKTGIHLRHIVGPGETASDLAVAAATRVLEQEGVAADSIDYLILCTQTPDYVMPSTALLVHERLGLRSDAGAVDVSLGCSGFVYSLGLAKGLIESGQVATVLIVTADTYSRLLNPADKTVRTLFGDGAAATLLTGGGSGNVHSFVYGSDGSGAGCLVVPSGGLAPAARFPAAEAGARGLESNGYDLYMDGPAVFNFTLKVVPDSVERVLRKADLMRDDIDTWVFHQANAFMLGHLRKKLNLPDDRFVIDLADTGNTVSSTIPIALARLKDRGSAQPGSRSLILGFGVGLSWAGAIIDW